ncbi:MAG TPA: site-specific integrase [Flavobacteriales bacterium]|nr:site-specific integrase [Flavobacteriales bacterium]
MAKQPKRRSSLGSIITHRGHYRARYLRFAVWHTPGHTFSTFALADQWLAAEQLLIDRDEWTPPAARRAEQAAEDAVTTLTFGAYAERWISERQVGGQPIKQRTAHGYRDILAHALAPFCAVPLVGITREAFSAWYHQLDPTKVTARSHAYALFRSIMATAVDDGLVPENPVHKRGAGHKPKRQEVELFTVEQIGQLADLMPPQHRAAVLLAAWCGLRFGELAALRRSDLSMPKGGPATLSVRRGVVKVGSEQVVTTPKSASGVRTIPIPPNIVEDVREHLRVHAQWGADGLLFPPSHDGAEYLTPGQLYGHRPTYRKDGTVRKQGGGYYRARHLLGRDDLSFHKLRHFAATNYAVAGATTKELMTLLGHAGPTVAMRYQHAAQSRMTALAERMAALAQLPPTDTAI